MTSLTQDRPEPGLGREVERPRQAADEVLDEIVGAELVPAGAARKLCFKDLPYDDRLGGATSPRGCAQSRVQIGRQLAGYRGHVLDRITDCCRTQYAIPGARREH